MKSFLEAQGIEQWEIVENGYKVPKNSLKYAYELTKYNTNSNSRNRILNALDKLVFVKVMHSVHVCKAYMGQAPNYL